MRDPLDSLESAFQETQARIAQRKAAAALMNLAALAILPLVVLAFIVGLR